MPTARRPAALLPAPVARTVGFALLATLGAGEWARMVSDGGLLGALPWVLVAVLAGEAVGAASALPPRLRAPGAALVAALGPRHGSSAPARSCCSPRWRRSRCGGAGAGATGRRSGPRIARSPTS